jgi:Histidine kinase-, DNA gyrase B-, and HSP90-like ATPase
MPCDGRLCVFANLIPFRMLTNSVLITHNLTRLFMNLFSIDIYNQKSQFKIALSIAALLVGGLSFYYTNTLIKKLEEREIRQMELYATALKYVVEESQSSDNENVNFILNDVVKNNHSVPAIVGDEKGNPTELHINVDMPENLNQVQQKEYLRAMMIMMAKEHKPIEIEVGGGLKGYVYYSHSRLLTQLKYYPIIQFLILLVFGGLGYLAFSNARRAEQNRVWVGLAKETAHQLGTPLSSLTAWVEFFKSDPTYDPEIVKEIEKDVERLGMITTRFSNIGSVPTLKDENIAEVVVNIMNYLQKRISTKVKVSIDNQLSDTQLAPMNRYLFEWVIENICKNAVDAMEGVGMLHLKLHETHKQIFIDITDTGKGIPRGSFDKVFNAGFSTKKRGWGLGLTLAKRIVENYHKGKLFVWRSEVGKGTTFRIVLTA